jgi:hypothetical protein
MKTISLFTILFFALVLHACKTTHCTNSNPVFDKFTYETEAYKRELAKQMKQAGPGTLGYTFDEFVEKNGNEFIVVNIQGDGICARGEILVKDWGKLQAIRDANGGGYRGAALEGLKIETVQDSAQTQFVYSSIERIVD